MKATGTVASSIMVESHNRERERERERERFAFDMAAY